MTCDKTQETVIWFQQTDSWCCRFTHIYLPHYRAADYYTCLGQNTCASQRNTTHLPTYVYVHLHVYARCNYTHWLRRFRRNLTYYWIPPSAHNFLPFQCNPCYSHVQLFNNTNNLLRSFFFEQFNTF